MKLKKWIKNLVSVVFTLLLILFGSLTDFEMSFNGIITLLILLGLFAASGMILLIDSEKRWNEIFK